VSSTIGLSAMMVSFNHQTVPDFSLVAAVLLGMALGSVLGMFNGLVISIGKVPPIIATLGTLSVYRGLVFLYSNGTWNNAFEMSKPFKQLAKGTPLGLPNLVIFAIVITILVYVFLNYTRTGRDIYAVGSNP
jgi:rhamnose transport system permease protein